MVPAHRPPAGGFPRTDAALTVYLTVLKDHRQFVAQLTEAKYIH